jgi:PleD family two-component response regulator
MPDARPAAEPGGSAAMMIDVDRFKQVNDRFGHDVGDRVLAAVAGILSVNVRPMDLAARLGGREELPTLLGDADRHLYRAENEGRSRVATG